MSEGDPWHAWAWTRRQRKALLTRYNHESGANVSGYRRQRRKHGRKGWGPRR